MTVRTPLVALNVMVAAVVVYTLTLTWSWWLLAYVPLLALLALVDDYVFSCVIVDALGQPATGRDADQFAKWRAHMTREDRAVMDGLIAQQQRRQPRPHLVYWGRREQ